MWSGQVVSCSKSPVSPPPPGVGDRCRSSAAVWSRAGGVAAHPDNAYQYHGRARDGVETFGGFRTSSRRTPRCIRCPGLTLARWPGHSLAVTMPPGPLVRFRPLWSARSGSSRHPVYFAWRGGRWPNNGPTGLSAGGTVASQVLRSEAVVGHPPPDPVGVGGSRGKVQGGAHSTGHGFRAAGEAAEGPGHRLGAGRHTATGSQADAVEADELHEQPARAGWRRPELLEARGILLEALEALCLGPPDFDVGPTPNRADLQGDDGLGEAPLSLANG